MDKTTTLLVRFTCGFIIFGGIFGAAFGGDKLTNKAMSNDATRTTEEIHEYISAMSAVDSII